MSFFYGKNHDNYPDFPREVDYNEVGYNGVGYNGVDYNEVDYNEVDYNEVDYNEVGVDAFHGKHLYPISCVAFESHEKEHCVNTFQRADDQINLHHKG